MLGVYENSKNFQDPRVGTDTPGPGEAVFAIRFIGKPVFTVKNLNFQTKKVTDENRIRSIVRSSFEYRLETRGTQTAPFLESRGWADRGGKEQKNP